MSGLMTGFNSDVDWAGNRGSGAIHAEAERASNAEDDDAWPPPLGLVAV